MKLEKVYNLTVKGNEATVDNGIANSTEFLDFTTFQRTYNHKLIESLTDDDGYTYEHILIRDESIKNGRRDPVAELQFTKNSLTAADLKDACFYRTPKLDLPQAKMQLLKEKYNAKVIRNKDKADYMITSRKYLESIFEYDWTGVNKASEMITEWLPNVKLYVSESIYDKLSNFLNHVSKQDAYVVFQMTWHWNFENKLKSQLRIDSNHALSKTTKYPYYIKSFSTLNYILNNKDIVCLDSEIIDFCNEDSVILTREDCASIAKMIKSDDSVNIALALEMMANCNIEKSYDKIALIFAFYDHLLRYASNWNTVNVKSLRKYMHGVKPVDLDRSGHGYNVLIKHLHKKNALNNFTLGAISNKMCKTILKNIGLTHDTSVFDLKPKDLKLKEVYNQGMDLPF
jgi:hypothetical protein